MFINKNSLQVTAGGKTINLGDYILEAKYQYPKLWSDDSGRNLKGDMVATLVGIFVKITIQFRKLSQTELETIAPILDSPTQSIRYYDPKKKDYVTMSTYTSDWDITNKNISSNSGFSISFIARSKRQ